MVNTKNFESYIGNDGKAYFKKQNPTKQVKKVVKGSSGVKVLNTPKFVQFPTTVPKKPSGTASEEQTNKTTEVNPPKQKKTEEVKSEKKDGNSLRKTKTGQGTNLLTPDEVKALQRSSGGVLKVDGIVGPKTRAYAQQINMPLTKEQFNAQSKVGEQVVVPSTEIPYTGKFSNMKDAAILYNLPSNITPSNDIYMKSADVKKQMNIPAEPGLASSTQFNADDFKRFDDIRALQADQGMSELEAMARYGQGMKSNNASGLAEAFTPNETSAVVPAPIPVTNVDTSTNKVNQTANDIARLNASIKAGMEAVDAQNYMKATTGK